MSKIFLTTPSNVGELIIKKVCKLNADGTETDVTDRPELWFPKLPKGKALLKLRLWKIINDRLNFHTTENQLPTKQ